MKKYVFLFIDENTPSDIFLGEEDVIASGMYDAFQKVRKLSNRYQKECKHSFKIQLKEVQYFDDQSYLEAL